MRLLKDILFEQLGRDPGIMERLLEPYSKREVVQLATALERLRNTPLDARVGFFCITHVRNEPWNGGDGKRTEVVPAFYIKEDFILCYCWHPKIGEVDLWGDVTERNSLAGMDFCEAMVLAAHNIKTASCFWTPGMASALLAAEVPASFVDKYGYIGEVFLREYFRKCIATRKRAYGLPVDEPDTDFTTGREMTAEEMQRLVRDVVIFNRLGVAQDLQQAKQEIYWDMKKQMVKTAICDSSQVDMPFTMLTDSDEQGETFLREVQSEMEEEYSRVVHLTIEQFGRRVYRCLKEKHMILLISGLEKLPEEENRDSIESALIEMLEADRKLVFTTSVAVSDIDMNHHLKELISQGLATYIDNEQ